MDYLFDELPQSPPSGKTLTADELAQIVPLTPEEIEGALEQGQRDVAAVRRFAHHSPVNDLRFRG